MIQWQKSKAGALDMALKVLKTALLTIGAAFGLALLLALYAFIKAMVAVAGYTP